jgi:hypothetical protein
MILVGMLFLLVVMPVMMVILAIVCAALVLGIVSPIAIMRPISGGHSEASIAV